MQKLSDAMRADAMQADPKKAEPTFAGRLPVDATRIDGLRRARLPRWLLPADWPRADDASPALARIDLRDGLVRSVVPEPGLASAMPAPAAPAAAELDLQGAPVLPAFVDAHTHLDKSFTGARVKAPRPGLLGAIEAMLADRAGWTPADVHARAERGLRWAWDSGTRHLRSHVDWWEPDSRPVAWHVIAELADAWAGRMRIEQVALIKLSLFEDAAQADRLARAVAATGPQALLGGFVHSTIWSEAALRHLLLAAQRHGLDVDLHVDEELEPAAVGLASTARILREIGFEGRVVCGHACALAAQDDETALATLDAVARAPITLVSLPATNLLLQDAVTGRTPRRRGLTLVKEACARGIPLLYASDNVQDPFCRLGSFDPAETLGLATLVAQLDEPFDEASESICRHDWLARTPDASPSLVGRPADLVLFPDADAAGWPARSARRVVLRDGRPIDPASPTAHPCASSPHESPTCSTATSRPTAFSRT